MAEPCPQPRLDCPYAGTPACIITTHHQYWPKRNYKTQLEHHFRNLPDHTERLARCDHDDLHEYSSPPKKPSLETMIQTLGQRAIEEGA